MRVADLLRAMVDMVDSAQTSFILQFYCTTNAIGGVWIYGNGSL